MKILYVTTISITMNAFFKPHIEMLIREGHSVDLACNFSDLEPDKLYSELGCNFYHIDFSRSPLSPDNIRAYGQLKKVVESGGYDIVHCHTPNASVITRLVCRKMRKSKGLKVFYTAHGFHFYKGAPKLNWMIFYPVEKLCSRFTDKLITINKEDYELAKNKFRAKEVHYVPGVGIDLSKFDNAETDKKAKRNEFGIPQEPVVLVSVGEVSKRKNHKVVLQALKKLDDNVHYVIVGQGPLLKELQLFSESNELTDRVHFLGQRNDIADLYRCADICCFPSLHEGLPVALMEAMACALPVVCSKIRGNTDLIDSCGGLFFDPYESDDCYQAITKMMKSDMEQMGKHNQKNIQCYSVDEITLKMKSIYES